MNNSQKIVSQTLVQGGYLRNWLSISGKHMYRLYDSSGNPILNVRRKTVKNMEWEGDCIFKEDKRGNITFNLQSVRKLDGRKGLKRIYKKNRKPNNFGK